MPSFQFPGIIKALRPWIVLTKQKAAAHYYATTLRVHPQLLYSGQSQNIEMQVPVKASINVFAGLRSAVTTACV